MFNCVSCVLYHEPKFIFFIGSLFSLEGYNKRPHKLDHIKIILGKCLFINYILRQRIIYNQTLTPPGEKLCSFMHFIVAACLIQFRGYFLTNTFYFALSVIHLNYYQTYFRYLWKQLDKDNSTQLSNFGPKFKLR